MTLSEDQIRQIKNEIARADISLPALKDDLIDHVCSATEHKIAEGKTFEASLKEAFYELAPEGLKEIERETIILLNSKKYVPMKRLMFFIGCICTMTISMGWLLKFLRVEGEVGNMLFGLGSFGFLILFLPMIAINYFKTAEKSTPEKLRFVFGISSIIIIGIAILARLMHMPGADEVMIIGLIIFTFGFVPFLFFTMYKKSIS